MGIAAGLLTGALPDARRRDQGIAQKTCPKSAERMTSETVVVSGHRGKRNVTMTNAEGGRRR